MARKYANSRAEVTAQNPSFVGPERRNPDVYDAITESFTVPASADAEGRYRVQLQYVPLKKLGFAVTVNSLAKTIVRYGTTLSASEVGVLWTFGVLDFDSSLAGLTGSCLYEHRGTAVTVLDIIQIEKELESHQTDLQGKVDVAGDTMTGPLILSGDPAVALGAATKQYVDATASAAAAGLDAKQSVECATTANITLSGEQTIDGVTTSASRVLVKNQSTASQNGIYVSGSGAWTRATDMDSWAEVPNAFCFVEQGTTQSDTQWVCTSNSGGTLGSTAITWTQFGAGVARPADVYVLANTSGAWIDYTDFDTAITALNALSGTQPVQLWIMPGTYTSSAGKRITRQNIHLRGLSRAACVVESSVDVGVVGYLQTTNARGTIDVQANNCSIDNLTIKNTRGSGFGVALIVGYQDTTPTADNFACRNCTLIGKQDTFWMQDSVTGGVLDSCTLNGATDVCCNSATGTIFRNLYVTGDGTWSAFWSGGGSTYIYDCVINNVGFAVLLASTTAYVNNVSYLGATGTTGFGAKPLFQSDPANSVSTIYYGVLRNLKPDGTIVGTVNRYPIAQPDMMIAGKTNTTPLKILNVHDTNDDVDYQATFSDAAGWTFPGGITTDGPVNANAFAGDGAAITGIDPANISSGTCSNQVAFDNGNNQFAGAFRGNLNGVTGDLAVGAGDWILWGDVATAAADIIFTLPASTSVPGKEYRFFAYPGIAGSGYFIHIATIGGEYILSALNPSGSSDVTLSTDMQTVTIVSVNGAWAVTAGAHD